MTRAAATPCGLRPEAELILATVAVSPREQRNERVRRLVQPGLDPSFLDYAYRPVRLLWRHGTGLFKRI